VRTYRGVGVGLVSDRKSFLVPTEGAAKRVPKDTAKRVPTEGRDEARPYRRTRRSASLPKDAAKRVPTEDAAKRVPRTLRSVSLPNHLAAVFFVQAVLDAVDL
jgi:hypothetical protein